MTPEYYRYDDIARSKLEEDFGVDIDENLFDEIIYDYDHEDGGYDEDEEYCEHQSGRYPYFTQYDPIDENSKKAVPLFQLDLDSSIIMWATAE